MNAAGEGVVVDAIYWLPGAAAVVRAPAVARTASASVLLLLLLSLLLKWCGQSGMEDCIGNLFREMVFSVGVAVAPFW